MALITIILGLVTHRTAPLEALDSSSSLMNTVGRFDFGSDAS